ncbi:hypothetical protein ACMFMG_002042 [Clarireedia jacksonii]
MQSIRLNQKKRNPKSVWLRPELGIDTSPKQFYILDRCQSRISVGSAYAHRMCKLMKYSTHDGRNQLSIVHSERKVTASVRYCHGVQLSQFGYHLMKPLIIQSYAEAKNGKEDVLKEQIGNLSTKQNLKRGGRNLYNGSDFVAMQPRYTKN